MTDAPPPSTLVSHQFFALARWRRGTRRLAERLWSIAASARDIEAAFAGLHQFLDLQHRHFQELIARSDDVEHFCRRCQEISEGDDPDRMARERDWLLAGYRKRNTHRRPWLDKLGLGQ